jgi:carboxypeptidase Q
MYRNFWLPLLSLGLLTTSGLTAEERIDHAMNAKIRMEGREHSLIMRTMHMLTDVYGPRLTGSPNYKAAADWSIKQMQAWGLENAHLEPWDFGHPGWVNERFSAMVVSPVQDSLVVEVLAWSPSTNGNVRAQVFRLVPPEGPPAKPTTTPAGRQFASAASASTPPQGPTREELTSYLEKIKPEVKGAIVFVGRPAVVAVDFNPAPKRRDSDQLRQQYDPNRPPAVPQEPPAQAQPMEGPKRLTPREADAQVDAFLLANGALVRVNDSGRAHGQIRAFQNRTYDTTKVVPTIILRNEDYGRLWRIADDGTPVEMEVDVVNHTYPDGKTTYNVVAEISGTDKFDEVVMLGGHLDSWHAATGATDNAVGCAIMMEAARILKALGIKPRRTIRVALWSAEEQGLLGSAAYVKEHFGTAEEPKAHFPTFNGYFNVDSGTGRVRGASVFGPPEAAAILREVFAPFEDLGVAGVTWTESRRTGGTDSTSFNAAGLPGIGMSTDPIEYGSHTWHTNLDTYERIVEEDAKKSAIVIAAAVYHLAMRDEMLPRYSRDKLPPAPKQGGGMP